MKKYSVKFHTYHESYNGYDHSDGWKEYTVEARNDESAKKKALKLWNKDYHSAFWIQNTYINEIKL
jgi:hypothetical protein